MRNKDNSAYQLWKGLKARCANKNHSSWARYGGRGIKPCRGIAESFHHFIRVLGARPSRRHSVDRMRNELGYFCGDCDECRACGHELNCRWATDEDQMRNTRVTIRITHDGLTLSLKEWATRLGMKYTTLYQRFAWGWSPDKAFTRRVGDGSARNGSSKKRSALTVLRDIWRGAVARCHDSGSRLYQWYGAKGVEVCPRWRSSFNLFLKDVGLRPSPHHSLDRYPNPAGNYEPGNVRWATDAEQGQNKRVTGYKKMKRTLPRHIHV